MEYLDLFEQLSIHNVRYLICGGLAVNIYGIPRMTTDIDLLLDFTTENINKFENAISILDYKSTIPLPINALIEKEQREKVIKEKNLIAYSFFNSRSNYMSLDVLIDVPFAFEELWDCKEERSVEGVRVNIVSVEHLIELKKYANRKQDKDDVLLLSKLLKK